ncbi:mediator of RNA polymerase II transcription subunit 15-like [Myzus persicae]|uniref:mediator of RNA polymerase II transcription subunit 15-like n=1 Tax=Myzus persicae TaxID=13164 RepID=UPI000B932788|nr:mediator of RNA polymerase II transcription subunit 15-like [Myzus persicae]
MKVVLTVLALVTTLELVLGVPVYGPPQPLPISHKYRSPNGAPIPAKYPPHPSGHSGKNEFYSKFNPHSLPPGLRGPPPQLPPPFAKYPHLPPPGKHQQQYQQQNQHQHQQQHQQQQQQHHQHQQQQQHQQQPHHPSNSLRPVGPQFQSKPHLLQNGAPHHSSQQNQVNNGPEQRVQLVPSRPTSKITNVWTGPKLSGSPDFPPHFPAASNPIAQATAAPFLEKPRGPYIINSDDERGPIKTIPAPNLNPADKPANFEEQLYRAQHQQSYAQPLDNSITDEKLSYQVTEEPSGYKPFNSQPSYFAQDLGQTSSAKVPSNTESNSIPTVPLDIALQQHLDNQHQQQLSAEHIGSTDTLTPQELYSLLNGNQAAAAVVPQTTYVVPQTVMYAVPQPQSLDLQVGHQLQYQAPPVQLQYAQQPAATGVQLQYAQPAAADLQYLQPQTVQYQPQAVQYQPQSVQYQTQSDHLQQPYQQQSAEQYSAQTAAAEISAQKQQQQQELIQQQQEQQQQQQEQQQYSQQQYSQQQQVIQLQQQQREQLKQQQQVEQQQQQQQQQQQDNDSQYQQEHEDYEPRNGDKGSAEQPPAAVPEDEEHDQRKLQSIRDQYYSAVPNEQTASVLAQIAQSAANNGVEVADEPGRVADSAKPAEKSPPTDQSVQMHTSVQIQQSVPLYEGTYASSRRTNQEYADEGGESDELMEGSESVAVSESPSSSVNGHAPNQFPYSAAKINAFAAN